MAPVISRVACWFLIVAGLFNIVVWPRFAVAVVRDDRAWAGGANQAWKSSPTSFFWVHAVLITVAVLIGIGILVVGVLALRRGV